jgi:Dimethlysulfonioproprionate lyase
MSAPTPDVDIAERIKALLESLRHPALGPFLADWPRAYLGRADAAAGAGLPVLRWLPKLNGDRAAFCAGLVSAVCRAAPLLAWRQTYTAKDLDAGFLANYGWSEIIGGQGPFASEQIACGFLILGPATHYPRHHHDAEEFYLPLSGTAAWQQGDAEWRQHPPGTPIHHACSETHAMRTGADPLLALYLWRGAGLTQKSQLDAAPHEPGYCGS